MAHLEKENKMEIVFIIFLIMALSYTFIYFLFIRKYKDLKKLFIINKLYDVFVIIPEIFIGFYSIVFFRILLIHKVRCQSFS